MLQRSSNAPAPSFIAKFNLVNSNQRGQQGRPILIGPLRKFKELRQASLRKGLEANLKLAKQIRVTPIDINLLDDRS